MIMKRMQPTKKTPTEKKYLRCFIYQNWARIPVIRKRGIAELRERPTNEDLLDWVASVLGQYFREVVQNETRLCDWNAKMIPDDDDRNEDSELPSKCVLHYVQVVASTEFPHFVDLSVTYYTIAHSKEVSEDTWNDTRERDREWKSQESSWDYAWINWWVPLRMIRADITLLSPFSLPMAYRLLWTRACCSSD